MNVRESIEQKEKLIFNKKAFLSINLKEEKYQRLKMI